MAIVAERKSAKTAPSNLISILKGHLKRNEPSSIITWIILGGKTFMASKPSSIIDFVTASAKGIPKLSVLNLAVVLDVPMKDMAVLLNVSYKTLGRKKKTDVMNTISSSFQLK